MSTSKSGELLSALEVARELSVCRKTVYSMVHKGLLPKPIHILGCSRWRREDVERVKAGPRKLRKSRRREVG